MVEGDLDELTLGLIDGEGGELVDDDDAAELGEADLADGLGFAGIEVDVLGGAGGAGAAILDEDFDRVRDGMQDGVDVRLDALGDLGFGEVAGAVLVDAVELGDEEARVVRGERDGAGVGGVGDGIGAGDGLLIL